jgi:oxygen-independent coproporphyrinogen III oxidase
LTKSVRSNKIFLKLKNIRGVVEIIKADFEFSPTAFTDFIKLMVSEAEGIEFSAVTKIENREKIELEIESRGEKFTIENVNYGEFVDEQKTVMFKTALMKRYGKNPRWGSLIGVRPTKLLIKMISKGAGYEKSQEILKELYLVSDDKINLLESIVKTELKYLNKNGVNVYIGVPYCPTRCTYCSFASYEKKGKHKAVYDEFIVKLLEEIESTGKFARERGLKIESIYIGGGTPTILEEEELDKVLNKTAENFEIGNLKEFTVEAGRVDTITNEKLEILKKYGVTRISLNPQTFKGKTLENIGRKYNWEKFEEYNNRAKELGFIVNMDLIAGLPDETTEDIVNTLEELKKYNPDNFTVHMLAIKRGSKLIEKGHTPVIVDYDIIERKIESTAEELKMKPYYMYRQKNSIDEGENRGYSLEGKESLFNIEMIEENQNTIGIGGGAISKIITYKEIKRVINPKDPIQYIKEFEERMKKKFDMFEGRYENLK